MKKTGSKKSRDTVPLTTRSVVYSSEKNKTPCCNSDQVELLVVHLALDIFIQRLLDNATKLLAR
jgi:hypothetical protein